MRVSSGAQQRRFIAAHGSPHLLDKHDPEWMVPHKENFMAAWM